MASGWSAFAVVSIVVAGAAACLTGAARSDPVAFWPFEEGGGTVAQDLTGNCDDARLHGVEWCTGQVGGGLQFGGTGADGYLEIGDCEVLNPASGFTIQFQWRKTGDAVQIFFRKAQDDRRLSYYAYLEGDLQFVIGATDGKQYHVSAPRPPDGWHHLAFTFDGEALAIIVDGQVAGRSSVGRKQVCASEAPLLIGTHSPGYRYCLGGVLDELCVSDAALAPDQLDAELARARLLRRPEAAPAVFRPQKGVLVLARDGRPGATIVVRRDATALQTAPARELQRCLRTITGARLPIRDDGEPLTGNLILVGESPLTREMRLPAKPLEGDSYLLKTAPGRLVLLGHDELLGGQESYLFSPGQCKSGTSNAVQAFLHDICGVRWFMPGRLGEIVRPQASLEVPALNVTAQPARTYALGSFQYADVSTWARRNLFGSAVFIKHFGGHLWYSLIPEQRYFADHPDWFALLDGRRTGKGNHLCTTNQAMFAEAARNLKALYAEGYEWVECGQTDGYQRCRCEACEAMDEYRDPYGFWVVGKPADRIHRFHAALAREVAQAYPGRKLLVIAYGPSAEVPQRFTSLPGNVVIEFTHDPPELLARWRQRQHQFTSYVYWFGLYHPLGYGPKSSPQHVASEMRRHRAAGSEAFFFCGGGECWGTEAPSYYVTAELLRNPNLSETALVHDFCQGLFGPAGPTMEEYFRTFLAAADAYQKLQRADVVPGQPFQTKPLTAGEAFLQSFDAAALERCDRLLERAAREATEEAEGKRVRFFRDGFEYVRLTWLSFRSAQEWQQKRDEQTKAALEQVLRQRENFVRELVAREAGNGAGFPPVFRATEEDLLWGPGGEYRVVLETSAKAATP